MEVWEQCLCKKLHVVPVMNQLDGVVLELWEQAPCSELQPIDRVLEVWEQGAFSKHHAVLVVNQ
jgi:hypothetical protein